MTHHLSQMLIALSIRTAIVALWLIFGLRIAGKRQLGQMNIYDLALIMLVANAVQNAMTEGDGHLASGIASAGTLLFIGAAMTFIFVRQPKLEQRLTGMPTILISDGVENKEAMRREGVQCGDLMLALRQHELYRYDQVKLAVLEPDGTISVVGCGESEEPDDEDAACELPPDEEKPAATPEAESTSPAETTPPKA